MRRLSLVLFFSLISAVAMAASLYPGRELVVELWMEDGSHCTGTKVGRHTILTATHCLEFPDPMIPLMVGFPAFEILRVDLLDKIDETEANVQTYIDDQADHILITVDQTFTKWAEFGEEPQVGDRVYYWGSPAKFGVMLREGVVAGKLPDGQIMIDINGWHGDSGSAVMDRKGRIVGVISTIHTVDTPEHPGALQFMGMYPIEFTKQQLRNIK